MRGEQKVDSANPEDKYQALEKYGRDLTAVEEEGKFDPVIGREEEIRRVIQILSRSIAVQRCAFLKKCLRVIFPLEYKKTIEALI